ncbi:hypothetical protein FH609_019250 [Streptomyces sp. 3MP-14]|uniref:Uncharacterized protein n=1 Tax=Streptomyces mimosae TaxID=2586635 RepID=A0A5N6A6D3_9ACTN|nr:MULTISPECIES: hypothetical protein [Streptomyces]KAB8163792.1 hypothetical protein FH607_017790 [Streptomyces mimosae]KAB8175235.1 hypothetical protein FH609_019250 [Streptomyces sp. 3MP-14]
MAKKAPRPHQANLLQDRQGFRPLTEPEEVTPDPEGNRAQRRAAAKAAKKGTLPETPDSEESTEPAAADAEPGAGEEK